VAEEAGLADLTLLAPKPFDLDVHEILARGAEPAHRHFDVRYLFRAGTNRLNPGADVGGARWLALEGIGPEDSDESVLRAVRKLQAGRTLMR
jgi:hypothetical protein